jgi:hypothetical protein
MDSQLRTTAERRLTDAAAAAGLQDPRPAYRERLRQLREIHTAAFERAIAHYEQNVLPALATGEPLAAWAEYGAFLGGLTAAGRVMRVDTSGRAEPWQPPQPPRELVLFLPDDTAGEALVIAEPLEPSPAQRATIELLVNRKLALG